VQVHRTASHERSPALRGDVALRDAAAWRRCRRILSTPSAEIGNFPIASMLRRIQGIPGQSLPKITFSVSRPVPGNTSSASTGGGRRSRGGRSCAASRKKARSYQNPRPACAITTFIPEIDRHVVEVQRVAKLHPGPRNTTIRRGRRRDPRSCAARTGVHPLLVRVVVLIRRIELHPPEPSSSTFRRSSPPRSVNRLGLMSQKGIKRRGPGRNRAPARSCTDRSWRDSARPARRRSPPPRPPAVPRTPGVVVLPMYSSYPSGASLHPLRHRRIVEVYTPMWT